MRSKKYFSIRSMPLIFLLSFVLFILSCAPATRVTDVTTIMNSFKISGSSQALLATNNCPSSSAIIIYSLEKKDGQWRKFTESFGGVIGRNGFAEPAEKREGDGKSPSGIFPLKTAFGYDEAIRTKMPYRQALPDDLWVDDVNAADYNRWVKKSDTKANSYENMKRDDDLYKYGLVIEYNTNPVIPGHGSAIFLHVWKGDGSSTSGCVATSEDNVVKILGWLDPEKLPLIIMGTESTIERLIQ